MCVFVTYKINMVKSQFSVMFGGGGGGGSGEIEMVFGVMFWGVVWQVR